MHIMLCSPRTQCAEYMGCRTREIMIYQKYKIFLIFICMYMGTRVLDKILSRERYYLTTETTFPPAFPSKK